MDRNLDSLFYLRRPRHDSPQQAQVVMCTSPNARTTDQKGLSGVAYVIGW